MTEQPSDAGLPSGYNRFELWERQRERLRVEERRLLAIIIHHHGHDDEPGRDHVVPVASYDDDAGHDPTPPTF